MVIFVDAWQAEAQGFVVCGDQCDWRDLEDDFMAWILVNGAMKDEYFMYLFFIELFYFVRQNGDFPKLQLVWEWFW